MIHVEKSPTPPDWLLQHGPAGRAALEAEYDADQTACQQPGAPTLKPLRKIYARPAVKQQLQADQHHKCAYCESKFTHSSPGDVEHFRPKAGYQQADSGPLLGPGYYWLAYEWDNLLFACEDCNRVHKRNRFPLRAATDRARSHHDNVAQEYPLLLNPATCSRPEDHLTFAEETAVGLTVEGETTWRVCGLNRQGLLDTRRDYLNTVKDQIFLATILNADPPQVDLLTLVNLFGSEDELGRKISAAQLNYERLARTNAPYAGMVRANFPHLPH